MALLQVPHSIRFKLDLWSPKATSFSRGTYYQYPTVVNHLMTLGMKGSKDTKRIGVNAQ